MQISTVTPETLARRYYEELRARAVVNNSWEDVHPTNRNAWIRAATLTIDSLRLGSVVVDIPSFYASSRETNWAAPADQRLVGPSTPDGQTEGTTK